MQNTVLNRIFPASPDVQPAFEAVSIFPRRAERNLARIVANVDDEAFDGAVEAGPLEDSVAFQDIGTKLRAKRSSRRRAQLVKRHRLNRVLLDQLERGESVSASYQLHRARDADESTEVARLASLAGREAIAVGTNRWAADHLSIAMELADQDEGAVLVHLIFNAGEACHLCAHWSAKVHSSDAEHCASDFNSQTAVRFGPHAHRELWPHRH